MWASALSSIALWAYLPELGKRSSIFASKSRTRPLSFSFAMIAAVACGALIVQMPSVTFCSRTKPKTSSVMSMSSRRFVELRARTLLTTTIQHRQCRLGYAKDREKEIEKGEETGEASFQLYASLVGGKRRQFWEAFLHLLLSNRICFLKNLL
jgi:hypothetical protein